MNALVANPTIRRKRLNWLCALSPYVVLFLFATMSLHVRLGFGYWPSQAVHHFPTWPLCIHDAMCVTAVFWNFFAAIHLLVTLIHHRELGVPLRQFIAQATVFVMGWLAFFVAMACAQGFTGWFMD